MDVVDDKSAVCVTELVISTDDKLENQSCDDNRQENDTNTTGSITTRRIDETSILGRHFELPDFSKIFDLDPPILDSSLPYIPVYMHLITHDLVAIEKPKTPAALKKLRSGRASPIKNTFKLSSTFTPRVRKPDDQAEGTIDYLERNMNVS